jgi:hypothetical protein
MNGMLCAEPENLEEKAALRLLEESAQRGRKEPFGRPSLGTMLVLDASRDPEAFQPVLDARAESLHAD